MNKFKSVIILLIIILTIGCATTEPNPAQTITKSKTPSSFTEAEFSSVATPVDNLKHTGAIVDINKYGNCITNLNYDDFTIFQIEYGDICNIKIGSKTITAPVVSSYSDVDLGKPLIRVTEDKVELAINMGNIANDFGIKIGDEFSFELKDKGGYKEEYLIRQLEKSDNRIDYNSDTEFANFRMIKTTGIADGKLYRSCNPILPDNPRSDYAYSLMQKAGIKAVINLANTRGEVSEYSLLYPLYNELYNNGKVIALSMNVDYTSKDFTTKLKSALLFLIEQETPVLIHCNEGKDRAGIVVAILEALAGASMNEIIEDYVLSYENYYKIEKGSDQYNKIASIIIDFFTVINDGITVGQKPLSATLKYLKTTVDLSVNDLAALRNMMRY